MRDYRLVLLLKSNIKKEQKDKLIGSVLTWAKAAEKKEEISSLGDKKLAYAIKQNKTAEYVLLKFQAEAVSADLNKKLQINEDIIRHLLIRD